MRDRITRWQHPTAHEVRILPTLDSTAVCEKEPCVFRGILKWLTLVGILLIAMSGAWEHTGLGVSESEAFEVIDDQMQEGLGKAETWDMGEEFVQASCIEDQGLRICDLQIPLYLLVSNVP